MKLRKFRNWNPILPSHLSLEWNETIHNEFVSPKERGERTELDYYFGQRGRTGTKSRAGLEV